MTDTYQKGIEDQTTKDNQQNTELRTTLSDASAALRGEQNVQAFNAYTFDEALKAQKDRINGPGTLTRPNMLDKVDQLLASVTSAINQIKNMPPEAFKMDKNEGTDVNTPNETEEESD
jgi:hypothetical protein